jgi:transcriptional regulator with XRE-family HTH domain
MTELLENIGHNIRRLRDEKGWNQTELGFRADTSPSIISLIENGKRNPSTATLAKIAGALGVEVVDLFPKGTRRSSSEPSFNDVLEEERRRPTDSEISALSRWLAYLERRLNEGDLTRDDIAHELDAASAFGIRKAPAEYPDEIFNRFIRLVRRALEEGKSYDALQADLAAVEAEINRAEETHERAKVQQT